jgi:hypothetical protein
MTLTAGDKFLRRVGLPGQVKRGVLSWRAFNDRDATFSLTFQDEGLCGEVGLTAYQEHFSGFIGGNLPGLFWLLFEGLTTKLSPPLPPRYDPDSSDETYGHLHCCTEKPHNRDHMELLAKLVNDGDNGGVLREFVKRTAA